MTTGQWRLCSVLDTFQNEYVGDLIEIRVGDSVIQSTFHHPVWVVEGRDLANRPRPDHVAEALEPLSVVRGRWVDAGDLQVGDVVLLQADREARIEAITVRPACAKVYNFEVEELHNYAVGADRVLVHNATPCRVAAKYAGKEGIYEFVARSGKKYVGQAADIGRRLTQHVNSGKLAKGKLHTVKTKKVPGGKTRREVAEQRRINQLGGVLRLENTRNPIGPARRHLLP